MKHDPFSVAQGEPPLEPWSDESPLASLYRRWRIPLVRLFKGRTANREQADDAAQDVFVRLAVADRTLAPEEEKPYLSTVARSVSTDDWRKNGQGPGSKTVSMECVATEVDSLQADDTRSPLEIAAQRQRIARLNDAVAELPERQRQAFLLNRIDGLTHEEVAAAMDISPRAVAKHLNRAMAYCRLRVRYASAEQMQRLHIALEDRDEGARNREDTR